MSRFGLEGWRKTNCSRSPSATIPCVTWSIPVDTSWKPRKRVSMAADPSPGGLDMFYLSYFSRFFLGRKLDELQLLYMNWHMIWIVELYRILWCFFRWSLSTNSCVLDRIHVVLYLRIQGSTPRERRVFRHESLRLVVMMRNPHFTSWPRSFSWNLGVKKKKRCPKGRLPLGSMWKFMFFFQIVDDSCSWFDRTGVFFIVCFFEGWRCLWNAFNLHLHTPCSSEIGGGRCETYLCPPGLQFLQRPQSRTWSCDECI